MKKILVLNLFDKIICNRKINNSNEKNLLLYNLLNKWSKIKIWGKTSIDLIRSHLSTADVYLLSRVLFRPLSINDLKSNENCHDYSPSLIWTKKNNSNAKILLLSKLVDKSIYNNNKNNSDFKKKLLLNLNSKRI
jgi:hypothetical protein